MNYIFDGIEEDAEKNWTLGNSHIRDKATYNKVLEEWLETYSKLMAETIPKTHVSCLISGNQEYSKFTFDEILHVLKNLGRLANHMRCAERDILNGDHVLNQRKDYPLERYYVSALEEIVSMVATFVQDKQFTKFTDLYTRLKELHTTRDLATT